MVALSTTGCDIMLKSQLLKGRIPPTPVPEIHCKSRRDYAPMVISRDDWGDIYGGMDVEFRHDIGIAAMTVGVHPYLGRLAAFDVATNDQISILICRCTPCPLPPDRRN